MSDGFACVQTIRGKLHEKQLKAVNADIQCISQVLVGETDESELLKLHRYLDGKYQVVIADWGKGMYNYNPHFGFDYNYIGKETLLDNLQLMHAKLDGYILGFNNSANHNEIKSQDVNVTVNNTVNITISIEEAKRKIDDMPGLTDADTETIKSKIDELDEISKEDAPKKKKWEKVKPILAFALDKGADVAITIMGLVLQMKLGM